MLILVGNRDEGDEKPKTDLKIKKPPQSSDHLPRDVSSPKQGNGVTRILKSESAFAKPTGGTPRTAGKRLAFADQVGGSLCEVSNILSCHYVIRTYIAPVPYRSLHYLCCVYI
ncbi:hypothetical protein EON65_29235 [archaeon]|nr:MAG: hypothetical protein EON65_29235 [archaeon]